MAQYDYKQSEINKMLFTELVIASVMYEDDSFTNEIKNRLKFCGFEDKMIKLLIQYELEILRATKKSFTDLFINKKFWFDDNNKVIDSKLLPLSLDNYGLYYNGNMTKNTLTNSELIAIYDEADFILAQNINVPLSVIKECQILSSNRSNNNIINEFVHRISYIYKRELNIEYNDDIYNKSMRFFINECHIVFVNKYNYKDKLEWDSYTEDYFNYYNY